MSKLRAIKLRKIYTNGAKQLEVLKGVDLNIEDSSFTYLVGPSGAGKSTLLHLLGGLDVPSEGRVVLDGIDLYALPEIKRAAIRNQKIGFVFQFYHLLPEFSALENVMLPGMIAKKSRMQLADTAESVLKEVGLAERMHHRPAALSGGEQQRVAIARALINDPEVIFCDEPTGNLDSETGEKTIQLLKALCQQRHKTIVMVTHEKTLVKYADRVVNIKDGKIIEPYRVSRNTHDA